MGMAFREGSGNFQAGGAEHSDRLLVFLPLTIKKLLNPAYTNPSRHCSGKAIKVNPALREDTPDPGLSLLTCFGLLKGLGTTVKYPLFYRFPFRLFYIHTLGRLFFCSGPARINNGCFGYIPKDLFDVLV